MVHKKLMNIKKSPEQKWAVFLGQKCCL